MAVDPERSAYSKYAEDLIPRTFLIDRDGRIVYQCAGFGEAIPEYQAEMSKLKKLIKSRLNKDG
jgi:hypothetical protein